MSRSVISVLLVGFVAAAAAQLCMNPGVGPGVGNLAGGGLTPIGQLVPGGSYGGGYGQNGLSPLHSAGYGPGFPAGYSAGYPYGQGFGGSSGPYPGLSVPGGSNAQLYGGQLYGAYGGLGGPGMGLQASENVNENANTNVNVNGASFRRSLHRGDDENGNTNSNVNVNTNSNSNSNARHRKKESV